MRHARAPRGVRPRIGGRGARVTVSMRGLTPASPRSATGYSASRAASSDSSARTQVGSNSSRRCHRSASARPAPALPVWPPASTNAAARAMIARLDRPLRATRCGGLEPAGRLGVERARRHPGRHPRPLVRLAAGRGRVVEEGRHPQPVGAVGREAELGGDVAGVVAHGAGGGRVAAGGLEGAHRALVGVALEPAGALLAGERLDDLGVVGDGAAAAAAPGPVERAGGEPHELGLGVAVGRERRPRRPTRLRRCADPANAAASRSSSARAALGSIAGSTRPNSSGPRRRDVVVGAHARGEAAGGGAQELVAGRVPVRLVRGLEAVQVDHRHRDRVAPPRIARASSRVSARSKPRWLGRPVSTSWVPALRRRPLPQAGRLDRLGGQHGDEADRAEVGVGRRVGDDAADGAPGADQRDQPASPMCCGSGSGGSSSSAPGPPASRRFAPSSVST